MLFTLFTLLQAQSTKIGWYVWAIAILFFVLGLGLLIYTMTRPKLTQDELEEGDEGSGLFTINETGETIAEPAASLRSDLVSSDSIADPASDPDFHQAKTKPLFEPQKTATPSDWTPVSSTETKPLATAPADFSVDFPVTDEVADDAITASGQPPAIEQEPEDESPIEEDFIPPPVQEEEALTPVTTVESAEFLSPASSTRVLSSEPVADVDLPPAEVPVTADLVDSSPEEVGEEIPAATIETAPIGNTANEPEPAEELEPIHWAPASGLPAERDTQGLSSTPPEDATARVDERAAQPRFARPEPAAPRESTSFQREPFEPPRIEPITPKQPVRQATVVSPPSPPAATERLSTPASPGDLAARFSVPKTSSETQRLGASEPPPPGPQEPAARPTSVSSRPTAQTESAWAASGLPKTASLTPAGATPRSAGRPAHGAILGLPADTSNAPLVLGDPVLAQEEVGVSGLSHYGEVKDDADTGRGGLITLAVVILLLGGLLISYLAVPAVKERANRLLGIGSSDNEVPVAERPKAQVIPSLAMDFNKNIVKARGVVRNVSDETLDGLSVEITLVRGEGAPVETKTVSLTPAQLAPLQQGQYEFEYDGSKSTGFTRYRVSKLIGTNGEVKFSTPSQK